MTDSIEIFPPGFRIPDTAGNPLPGALVYFYDAGTTTPKTVYSDRGLTTTLGTVITCDSAGYPSASSVRILIYTGIAAYKIVCTDTNGVEQWSHDYVKGALDTSSFLTSVSTTVTYTVTPVTTSGTWTLSDVQGKVFTGNPSGGNFTRTLPLASTTTGVPYDVKNIGFGIITLLAQGSDLIVVDGLDSARKAVLIQGRGDSVRIISDGVNHQVFHLSKTPQALQFAVEDQRTAPAGTPVVGGYYLLNGAPSGAFTATTPACAANDIVMYDGQANYQIFRPSTDCGWLVYDKATDVAYQYRGVAWVRLIDQAATQADMEAETSTTGIVIPSVVKHNPGVSKAHVIFNGTGTPAISASRNVTSLTDNGTGDYTVNFTTSFSDTNVRVAGIVRDTTANFPYLSGSLAAAPAAASCRIRTCNGANAGTDCVYVAADFFGDFA